MAKSIIKEKNKVRQFSVAALSTITIPVTTPRIIVTSHSSAVSFQGLYVLSTSKSVYKVIDATNLVLSYSDGQLSIQNTKTSGAAAIFII